MKIPNLIRNYKGRLSKQRREAFFQEMMSLVTTLKSKDQDKMTFARSFTDRLLQFGFWDGDSITVGPMDIRMLEYFIFIIAFEYDHFKIMPEE